MGHQAAASRITPRRISLSAVIGALLLVAGAIAFGIHGPRMGQRGIWLEGTPLSEAWFHSIDLYLDGFGQQRDALSSRESGDLDDRARPIVAAAEALGWTLEGGRSVDVFGGGVVDWFTRPGGGTPLMVLTLEDPWRFTFFDALGRQRPLAPGVRVIEAVPLFDLPWLAARIPAFGDVDELGVVVLGLRDEGVVIVSGGLDAAQEVADELDPPSEGSALRDAI